MSQIQSGTWDITADVIRGGGLFDNTMSKKEKIWEGNFSNFSLADTAFYCCSCGEDDGGVSRFSLGTNI